MQSKNTLANDDCWLTLAGYIIKTAILDFLSYKLTVTKEQIEAEPKKEKRLLRAIYDRRESAMFLTNEKSMFRWFDLNAPLLISKTIDDLLQQTKKEQYISFLKWQKEQLEKQDWYKIDPPNIVWYETVYIPEHAHECWSDDKGEDYGKEESETHKRILAEAKRTFKDKEVLRNLSGLLEKTCGKDW